MATADAETGSGPDLALLTVLVVGVVALLAVGGQLLRPDAAIRNTGDVQVSLVAAYIGGLLAFLSPCSVAVIPGFFAYSFDARRDLIEHTYVFYLGLALVFVPLGFGASLFGQVLRDHVVELSLASGVIMILLGLAILAPIDWLGSLSRYTGAGMDRATTETGRVFALGTFFGLATSTCTAPILAGITVLSVGAGLAPLESMLLFMIFALGIVTPLFGLAFAGDRSEALERIRGGTRTFRLGDRQVEIPTAELLAGVALILLGILFLATRGTRTLLDLYDALGLTALYEDLVVIVQQALSGIVGQVVSLAVVAAIVAVWWWRRG